MIWNADLAIVYACALTLLGGLVLWALPALFFAVVDGVHRLARQMSTAKSKLPARSGIPARSSHYPTPAR